MSAGGLTPSRWEIREGDALERLRELADGSVHACVTSPPYYNLRDYKVEGQIGLEKTPELFIERLVDVFREVRRVLRADGTAWVNIGDSYANDSKWGGFTGGRHGAALHGRTGIGRSKLKTGLPNKSLMLVPFRLALALQAGGWCVRSDIIWAKPNPQPESVDDRPTKSHEYVFLLSQSERYFYDADALREPHVDRRANKKGGSAMRGQRTLKPTGRVDSLGRWAHPAGRNARTVWPIATESSHEEHYAGFPLELPRRCILAGTSERGSCVACGSPWRRLVEKTKLFDGEPVERLPPIKSMSKSAPDYATGFSHNRVSTSIRQVGWKAGCGCGAPAVPCVVLDPFVGAGTTGIAALGLGRHFVGIDLSPAYVEIARRRLTADSPLFDAAAVGGAP